MNTSRIILGAIILIILFVSCGPNNSYVRRIQAVEEGVDNPVTIEELTSAIKKYQNRISDVLNADVRVGLWYKILASNYLDNKMYGKALENYRSAIEYYPTNQNLFYYIGVCAGYMAKASLDYEATGTNEQRNRYLLLAESAYRRALELEPQYVRSLYGLSILYVFEMNQPAKAIPLLELSLEVDKKNIDSMFVLARAYYATGSGDEAVALYDRILGITRDPVRKKEAEDNKAYVLQDLYGKE